MTYKEAFDAIIEEVETINFCGHCLEMKCDTCKAKNEQQYILHKLQSRGLINENDIIAEYVKEKFPEILDDVYFAAYRVQFSLQKIMGNPKAEKTRRFLQKLLKHENSRKTQ